MSRPDLPVDDAPKLEARQLRFDRMEWAGSLGDIGTLIPFLVAYIVVAGVPAMGILFCFGVAMIACGLYYRTPFPVQPMKAAGAVVARSGHPGCGFKNPRAVGQDRRTRLLFIG